MKKRVTFDGQEVIVEETMTVNGLFGEQQFVKRRHLTRDEWDAEAKKDMNNQLGGLLVAGIIAGGALLLQKAMDKKEKNFFDNIKLPWNK